MAQKSSGKDVVSIQSVGGSLQVSLPVQFTKANGLHKGEKMAVHFAGDRITYRPLDIEEIPPVV